MKFLEPNIFLRMLYDDYESRNDHERLDGLHKKGRRRRLFLGSGESIDGLRVSHPCSFPIKHEEEHHLPAKLVLIAWMRLRE